MVREALLPFVTVPGASTSVNLELAAAFGAVDEGAFEEVIFDSVPLLEAASEEIASDDVPSLETLLDTTAELADDACEEED